MTTPIYPEDLTGLAASNLVTGEVHLLTELNDDAYRILIPTFAPFYLHNLLLEHVDEMGVVTPLLETMDYYPCLQYMAATRSTGIPVYGGLQMNNRLTNGSIRLRYQTVGGQWCADVNYVYNRLLESVYNWRTTWWDSITNVQQLFPPTQHEHPLPGVEGFQLLLEAVQGLEAAIRSNQYDLSQRLTTHINDNSKHFPSPSDIGLGNIVNLPMATDQEVMEHRPLDKYVTLRQILMLMNINF